VDNCIVEAELLVFDEEKRAIEPFGTVQDFTLKLGKRYTNSYCKEEA
jgi:hypothetical protein